MNPKYVETIYNAAKPSGAVKEVVLMTYTLDRLDEAQGNIIKFKDAMQRAINALIAMRDAVEVE